MQHRSLSGLVGEAPLAGLSWGLLPGSSLGTMAEIGAPQADLKGSDVSMSASMALSLMMILHELAANSAKHGAFGCEEGRLRVRWRAVGPPASGELQLSWERVRKNARR